MTMQPEFTLHRYPHGWLIARAGGISLALLPEALGCIDKMHRGMSVDSGIAHHYQQTRQPQDVVLACGRPRELDAWRREIESSLVGLRRDERWWLGTDVGCSSATIFSVLSDSMERGNAARLGGGAAPQDDSDLGRCRRLLDLFPEWRARLGEVAAAHPGKGWEKIIPLLASPESQPPATNPTATV